MSCLVPWEVPDCQPLCCAVSSRWGVGQIANDRRSDGSLAIQTGHAWLADRDFRHGIGLNRPGTADDGALVRLNITEVRGIELSTARPVAVRKRNRSDCAGQTHITPLVDLPAVQHPGADRPCAFDRSRSGLDATKRSHPTGRGCGDSKGRRRGQVSLGVAQRE
jgi:hypothetical protein